MQKYILFIFLSYALYLNAQQAQNALTNFTKDPLLKDGSISFFAVDLESGISIANYNEKSRLICASTTKLFASATAIEVLGKNYSPLTRIYVDGPIDEKGVLHGNVWIRGSGDVSMGSKYFNAAGHEFDFLNQWTDSIISKGIKQIDGYLIADGSSFGYDGAPKGWKSNDLGNYFGAPHTGINFYDNLFKLYFDSGKIGTKAKLVSIYPKIDNLVLDCSVFASSSSGDECNIFGDPFSYDRKANGKIPANKKGFEVKGSMPDPEYQLVKEWASVLLLKGITISKGAKGYRLLTTTLKNDYADNFKLIFSHSGKSVGEVAYWTNHKSVNLFAEGLLNYVGYVKQDNGSNKVSIDELKKYWTPKLDITTMIINDGSGLSRLNAISASHFCDLLSYMYKSPNYADFKSTLPIAGVSGTIKNLCKGQVGEGRIFAKSGSLDKAKAYSGYVETISGKKIAFSFCVNNFSCTTSQLVNKMEVVLNALANY